MEERAPSCASRIVNVANGRFFNFGLAGHKFQIIGTDGGFVPKPFEVDHLLLSPGDRLDVLRVQGAPSTQATIVDDPCDRGHDSGKDPPMPLATIRFGASIQSTASIPSAFPAIDRLPDGPVDIPIELGEGTNAAGDLVFTVNGKVYPTFCETFEAGTSKCSK